MKNFESFLSPKGGYYREGEEDSFPWDRTSKTVWYSLMVIENGKINKYGFTPSKGSKSCLIEALESLPNKEQAELIGVWTGQYSTHLFLLDIDKSIEKLKAVV